MATKPSKSRWGGWPWELIADRMAKQLVTQCFAVAIKLIIQISLNKCIEQCVKTCLQGFEGFILEYETF